jgi:phage terminase large subunit-like protein
LGQVLDYTAAARLYARRVVEGKEVACRWVVAACARHLHDLEHGKDRGLRFDREAANRACRFIELLPHIKGEWAKLRELIVLQPWQIFIVANLFGWMKQKKGKWVRRFNLAYIEVARKNAKSTLAAAIALYMLAVDGEEGAEIYSAATTRGQARIVFGVARHMALRTPRYRERFGVEVLAHSLVQESTASSFLALSSDYDSLDGLNPHFVPVDELHAHKNRALWDVLETAMGSRTQPLLLAITTAGGNQVGICYEVRGYVTSILESAGFDDDAVFGIIFTADEPDKWDDPVQWRMANPNLGVSVFQDFIADKARKARQNAAALNNFKTKHLNIWINAMAAFFNMERWDAGADSALRLENFAGQECYIGLDLASSIDIASKAYLFPEQDLPDGRKGLVVFGKHYMPSEMIEERASRTTGHYLGWAESKHLTLTEGTEIDLDTIENELKEDCVTFRVRGLAHDPWQAKQMIQHLMAHGVECVEIDQTTRNFSPAMKYLEGRLQSGRVLHDGNPASRWMMSNVVARFDPRDNVYPRKENPASKIDFALALLNAGNRVVAQEPDDSISAYGGPQRPDGLLVV